MYRFIKDNNILETLEKPVWIKPQKNGLFRLCTYAEAEGVVLSGSPYLIAGNETECQNYKGTVFVEFISESAYNAEREEREAAIEAAIAELSILIESLKGGVFDV